MPTDKVKEFIKKLGAPKLTKEQVAIIKEHHEYHGDKNIKIIGALPGNGVFVRCISHTWHEDSVIDHFCYEKDCSEDEFIREASEEQEIRLIKKWLIRNLSPEERRKLIKRGAYDTHKRERVFFEKAMLETMDICSRLHAAVCSPKARDIHRRIQKKTT